MGEYADAIISGELCEMCMFPLAEPLGFPQTCVECGGDAAQLDVSDLDKEPKL